MSSDGIPELTVTNVVCLAFVDYYLPMTLLVEALSGRYDKNVFPPTVTICKETNTTQSMFSTGKLVITGSKSKYHGIYASLYLLRKIRRVLGLPLNMFNFSLNNIVGAANIGHEIDINRFYADHQETTNYCPELFPGLGWEVYEKDDPGKRRFTYTVYSRGPAICAGIKDIRMLPEAAANLAIFHKYKLNEGESQSVWSERKKISRKRKPNNSLREQSKNRKDAETEAVRMAALLATKSR